jgi:hypothetical protein
MRKTYLGLLLLGFFQLWSYLFHDFTTTIIATLWAGAMREHRGAAFFTSLDRCRSHLELLSCAIAALFGVPLFWICHNSLY